MFMRRKKRYRRMKMSHMMADTEEELHQMAEAIGMRREWFQGDHYDVSMGRRTKALALGAVPITVRQMAEFRKGKRK
jgi:hypothetical protein